MNGELVNIIFKFFCNIFVIAGNDSFNSVFLAIYKSLQTSGNFYENFATYFGGNVALHPTYLLCFVFTLITIIILFLCLCRLFKWIFSLVFKLFRAR